MSVFGGPDGPPESYITADQLVICAFLPFVPVLSTSLSKVHFRLNKRPYFATTSRLLMLPKS